MQAQFGSGAAATVVDILTCPTDHKYELQSGVISRNPATNQLTLWALDNAPGYMVIGSDVDSVNYCALTVWGNLVMYPGDILQAYAGSNAFECLVTYVDVDFST